MCGIRLLKTEIRDASAHQVQMAERLYMSVIIVVAGEMLPRKRNVQGSVRPDSGKAKWNLFFFEENVVRSNYEGIQKGDIGVRINVQTHTTHIHTYSHTHMRTVVANQT